MILALDIGNTQTCVGAFDEDSNELKCLWRFSTLKNITIDEIALSLNKILSTKDYKLQDISAAAISCVVPSLAVVYEKCIEKLAKQNNLNIKFAVCNPNNAKKLDNSFYSCEYPHPGEVGGDIIASCIAANTMYGSPCAIADFGTATNINVTNKNGALLGAIIAPGLKTSLDALLSDASALSDIELTMPEKIIGDSTPKLIQSGAIYGEVCRADGLIDKIEEEIGSSVKVICTGGWSKLISSHMKHDAVWAPNLVLQGLKIFIENFNE